MSHCGPWPACMSNSETGDARCCFCPPVKRELKTERGDPTNGETGRKDEETRYRKQWCTRTARLLTNSEPGISRETGLLSAQHASLPWENGPLSAQHASHSPIERRTLCATCLPTSYIHPEVYPAWYTPGTHPEVYPPWYTLCTP